MGKEHQRAGLKLFARVATVVSVVIIASFILCYHLWINTGNNLLTDPEKIQALTGMILLLIGSIASIGSAIVAIKLATLGIENSEKDIENSEKLLKINEKLEKKEKLDFIKHQIDELYKIYANIIIRINDIVLCARNIEKEGRGLREIYDNEKLHNPVILYDSFVDFLKNNDNFQLALSDATDSVLKLHKSIESLAMNEFAYDCFIKRFEYMKSQKKLKLEYLQENASTTYPSVNDICDILTWLSDCHYELKTNKYEQMTLLFVKLAAFEKELFTPARKESEKQIWEQIYRRFIFINSIISDIKDFRSGDYKVALSGCALIFDLIYCLPDSDTIFKNIINKYPYIIDEENIKDLKYPIPDFSLINSRFLNAIFDEINDKPDIFLWR